MAEKENKEIELRSEEFQEVLGNIPHWILRRGILIVGLFVFGLLIGSALFKYPDVITTTMTLTGSTPAAAIVAKTSGKLHELNVTDKAKVKTGDYLAVIENPANKEDILLLKTYLNSFDINNPNELSPHLNVGTLQSLYSTFYRCLFEYQEFIRLQYYEQKIVMMKERIAQYQDYYINLERQKRIVQDQFNLQENQFQRDSLLTVKGVLAGEEFEIAKSQYLQGALSLENILSTIQNTAIQITQMRESLLDMEQQYQEKKNTLDSQLKTYSAQLLSDIQGWEQTYALIAPVDGEVTFTTYWVENQNIQTGDVVFNIIPSENETLLGKSSMPMDRSGKVKIGQKVNIRFYNFPDNEFGIVKGLVKTISIVPAKTGQEIGNYIVEIELPEGLHTTYHKELPYLPEMQAQADIITENYSVLERFFMPLRKIFTEGFE